METFVRHASRSIQWIAIGTLAGSMFCLGCERTESAEKSTEKAAEAESAKAVEAKEVVRAVAQMKPTKGNSASGVVYFEPTEEGVVVRATITGLEPGTLHGFHIHEKGDCSALDATSAGGHYAPEGNPHGLPPSENRHAGDMGNIVADDEGTAKVERTFDVFSLDGENPVVGRAVILHAKEDSGAQPTGEAGARLACGVIETNAEPSND